MATVPLTYNSLTYEQKTFYEKMLIDRLLPNAIHASFGQKGRSISVPQHEGMTVDWRAMVCAA